MSFIILIVTVVAVVIYVVTIILTAKIQFQYMNFEIDKKNLNILKKVIIICFPGVKKQTVF